MASVLDGYDLALATDRYRVKVYSTGRIYWLPGIHFVTSCNVDLTHFPFDRQTCFINVTSWLYLENQVNFSISGSGTVLKYFETNGEWEVMATHTGRYAVDVGAAWNMTVLYCAVHMKRKPLFYIYNLLLPSMTLSLMSIFMFALPVESGEKISLGISALISYSVLTLLVADSMPSNGNFMPLLCTWTGGVG